MTTDRFANLLIDTSDLLASAETPDDCWLAVNLVASRIGALAVNAAAFLTDGLQPVWARSSMDPSWLQEYMESALYEIDPLLVGLQRGYVPPVLATHNGLNHLRGDPRKDQVVDGLRRRHYDFFCSHSWQDGPQSKLLVLCTDRDPEDLMGPGTARALRAVSAMLAMYLTGPGSSDHTHILGARYGRLTPRERDVLSLWARGYGPETMADRLALSAGEITALLGTARQKMHAESPDQALALAMARGEITL